MDSDLLASMYAYIVRGGPKEDCHYITDEESARAFDRISAQVEAMRKKNPTVHFEIPHEIPGRPGTSVMDDAATSAASAAPVGKPTEPPALDATAAMADQALYFVIQDTGDTVPWALVRVQPRGLYERWTGEAEGWVDWPSFASYFAGGEIGARQIGKAAVSQYKATIKAPSPGSVALMRGDDKRLGSNETTPDSAITPAEAATDGGPKPTAAGERRYFVIQDPGDASPSVLIALRPPDRYEMWTGPTDGWVDRPSLASYFVDDETGVQEIGAAAAAVIRLSSKQPLPESESDSS